jgi:hypothetical protein
VSAHWIAERQSAPMILRYGSRHRSASTSAHLPWRIVFRHRHERASGRFRPGGGPHTRHAQRQRLAAGGQKIWTTNAQHAHYMIALVRTSGQPQDRQQGLSQLLFDLSTPASRSGRSKICWRPALLRSVLRRCGTAGRCTDRRGRCRLGAGHSRAGLRAQRARADLLEHGAARCLAGSPARQRAARRCSHCWQAA